MRVQKTGFGIWDRTVLNATEYSGSAISVAPNLQNIRSCFQVLYEIFRKFSRLPSLGWENMSISTASFSALNEHRD